MKVLVYAVLLLIIVGCIKQPEDIIKISSLEVIIKEDKISLRLDNEGLISQNNRDIGKIVGNKVIDLEGKEVFTISENYIVYDTQKDTIADYWNKNYFINDGFFGVIKWSDLGNLETASGDDLNIQIVPNDSTLYRTASLVLLYGEHMKN